MSPTTKVERKKVKENGGAERGMAMGKKPTEEGGRGGEDGAGGVMEGREGEEANEDGEEGGGGGGDDVVHTFGRCSSRV